MEISENVSFSYFLCTAMFEITLHSLFEIDFQEYINTDSSVTLH